MCPPSFLLSSVRLTPRCLSHQSGFTEFVAASLQEGHVKDENLRLAFDRLDTDDTGKITLDNLLEFIGANSDELTIGEEITDETLHEALIGEDGDGLSYDVVSVGGWVSGSFPPHFLLFNPVYLL